MVKLQGQQVRRGIIADAVPGMRVSSNNSTTQTFRQRILNGFGVKKIQKLTEPPVGLCSLLYSSLLRNILLFWSVVFFCCCNRANTTLCLLSDFRSSHNELEKNR